MTDPARAAAQDAFLAQAGWADATRRHLAGDASARSYQRLSLNGRPAVVMDAPPGCGDDVADFLRIGGHLAGLGLSAPKVFAVDEAQGFMLLEDLGNDLFTRLAQDPAKEIVLYAEAVQALSVLQAHPAPVGLPDLTAADWAQSAMFAPDFYALGATGQRPGADAFRQALLDALVAYADGPRVLILRDFHAGNMLWLPDRTGPARVGLLDFQLGQMGQPEYDLVSLLQDARRDVAPETEVQCLRIFAHAQKRSPEEIAPAYATLGALRALRILGIFARLCLLGGKDQYLVHLPRVWGQLMRNLSHPALARLQAETLALLPAPTPDVIQRIKSKCASPLFP